MLTAETDGCRLEVRAEPKPGSQVAHGATIRMDVSSPNCELGPTVFIAASLDSDSSESGPARLQVVVDASGGPVEGVVVARFAGRAGVAQVPVSWTVRETRRPARLELQPDRIELDVGERETIVMVDVVYEDGSSVPARDLELQVQDERVARVVEKTHVQGWSDGWSVLRIQAAGLHAEMPIHVSAPIEVGRSRGASPCDGPALAVREVRAGEVVELFTGIDDGSRVETPGCRLTRLDLGEIRSVGVVTAAAPGAVTFCGPFDQAVQALVRDAARTTCAVSRLHFPKGDGK